MSLWFPLCPVSWPSILVRATWWLPSLSLTHLVRFLPQLFAFGSFKEHQHHLPGVYQMQVSGSLLCTTCPLQKGFWKKTAEKWTVSVYCHPPMVGSDSQRCEPASMKSDFLADIWAWGRLISACTAFQPANKNQLWFISSLYLHMHRGNSHWYCPLKSSAFFPCPVNSQFYSQ